jgi:hypothetical protein
MIAAAHANGCEFHQSVMKHTVPVRPFGFNTTDSRPLLRVNWAMVGLRCCAAQISGRRGDGGELLRIEFARNQSAYETPALNFRGRNRATWRGIERANGLRKKEKSWKGTNYLNKECRKA